jgi:hypothetical protein
MWLPKRVAAAAFTPKALLPRSIEYVVADCDLWNGARIVVEGVPVSLIVGVPSIGVAFDFCKRPAHFANEQSSAPGVFRHLERQEGLFKLSQ